MKTGSSSSPEYLDSIGYDHIMLLEDTEEVITTKLRSETNTVKLVFLAGCGFVALMGGFSLQLAISGRKYRAAVKNKTVREGAVVNKELEDPVLFASRALGWGTFFAVLATGSISLATVGIWKLLVPNLTL